MTRFVSRLLVVPALLGGPICLARPAAVPKTPAGSAPGHAGKPAAQRRWFYAATNLLVTDNVPKLQALLGRAKAAGYNGVVLSDYKFTILDQMPPEYAAHAALLRETASRLKIDIFPAVCPIGYSNGLLAHNPNLAEGLPVRDAPFVVAGREAHPAPAPNLLANGDFETAKGDAMAGWNFQDFPGSATFADRAVTHGGGQSLRMENIGTADPQYGHGRIMQSVALAPFRQYDLSVWVKTRDFETPGEAKAIVLDPSGQPLSFNVWDVKGTQDWTQYHVVFNSLGNSRASVYLGVWGGKGGDIWWDDARLDEAGLLNALRRAGCPLTVTGEDGTPYTEGRDFETVSDERTGRIPWAGEYEVYHAPPPLRLTANSRIPEGARLKVSFYHAIVINGGQVACCLSEPEVYALMKDQIRREDALFHPKGFFMSHDELRVVNWCDACRKRGLSPGQLLADNTRRCIAMIRAARPDAEIAVWSDMYDPYHNAHDRYFLANGTLAGSWRGLSPDVIIANWNFDNRAKSVPWFGKRGHPQVLAGYYDTTPEQIRPWLDAARGVPNATGVMYTTWADRYDDLEAFARAAWGTPKAAP